jgi:diguanylate cyclase (GGDEF)-like protein
VILQDNRVVLIRTIPDGLVSKVLIQSDQPVAGWAACCLANDRLWIGTTLGLIEYHLRTGQVLRQITTWQDLNDCEFTTSRSLVLDAQGRLICGLSSGLMIVNLEELEKIKETPTVKLGRIRWFNTEAERKGEVITFQPGNWTLEVEFFTAWFIDEDSLEFRHRLLGFDANWSEAKSMPKIEYSSLPPGEYTLELQAHAPLVGWGVVSRILTIVVRQPPLPAVLAMVRNWVNTSFVTSRQLRERNLALEQQVRLRTLEVAKINEDLQLANQKLQHLSFTDALTGVANRRQFDMLLENEIQRSCKMGSWLSLAMIDIDSFKGFNDAYGHPNGDRCLQRVASVLHEELREARDWVARYGGEEFAILLCNTDQKTALAVVERLRAAVERLAIPHGFSSVAAVVTISAGLIAIKPTSQTSALELLVATDRALYQAKHAGRNQVMVGE